MCAAVFLRLKPHHDSRTTYQQRDIFEFITLSAITLFLNFMKNKTIYLENI